MLEAVLVLLSLSFLTLLVIAQRLGRIEAVLRAGRIEGAGGAKKSTRSEERSGAFEKFLSDRPELRQKPKSEQFAAFRKWRKEQGLNWESKP